MEQGCCRLCRSGFPPELQISSDLQRLQPDPMEISGSNLSGSPGMSHKRHTRSRDLRSDTWQPLTLLTRVLGGNAVPSWPPGLPTQAVFHVFFAPANHSIARASHTALRREHGHHSPNGEIKHYLPVYSSWRQRQNYHEKEYTKVRECI